MNKIRMTAPIVEMDGDETTRLIWALVKDELLTPFIDLKTEYYDLGLSHRKDTDDKVTIDAAEAVLRLGVGVKCATITPNDQRKAEYDLPRLYPSPNGTLRAVLDGTIFRSPIILPGTTPLVPAWKKPITVARHGYGDIYKDVELPARAGQTFHLTNGDDDKVVFSFSGPGVTLAMHNTDESIYAFARSCFACALDKKQDLWFSCKDTISQTYDGRFRDIFQEVYETEYQDSFRAAGISYLYALIDDAVARCLRSEGGFVWALKNYDGDVMSDMIGAAFGALALMTSVLISPTGRYVYDAAHGTVTRHWRRRQQGERTSTNPMAILFAWTGALRKRGELDGQTELAAFARKLEDASIQTIAGGVMTGDMAQMLHCGRAADTEDFIAAIRENMERSL